jgi:hypothetical protein
LVKRFNLPVGAFFFLSISFYAFHQLSRVLQLFLLHWVPKHSPFVAQPLEDVLILALVLANA